MTNPTSQQPVSEKQGAPERVFIDLETGDWFPQRCGERPERLIECAPVSHDLFEGIFAAWQHRLWAAVRRTPTENCGMESVVQIVEKQLDQFHASRSNSDKARAMAATYETEARRCRGDRMARERLLAKKQAALEIAEKLERPASADLSRSVDTQDGLVDEVQRRMDLVVDAAVEWHQSGREGDGSWFEKSEVLSAAIDSLLELRAAQPDSKGGE